MEILRLFKLILVIGVLYAPLFSYAESLLIPLPSPSPVPVVEEAIVGEPELDDTDFQVVTFNADELAGRAKITRVWYVNSAPPVIKMQVDINGATPGKKINVRLNCHHEANDKIVIGRYKAASAESVTVDNKGNATVILTIANNQVATTQVDGKDYTLYYVYFVWLQDSTTEVFQTRPADKQVIQKNQVIPAQ